MELELVGEIEFLNLMQTWASQLALVVKNLPASAGDVRDMGSIPGWGRPPEKEMTTPPVFLSGKSHGQRSLASCSLWGPKSADYDLASKI